MPTTPATPCPGCGYDLGTIAGDAGVCPECGRAFSRAALVSRTDSLLAAALAMTGFAAAGLVLAGALGACVAYLPRTDPRMNAQVVDPDVAAATRTLRTLPALLGAAGVGVLGCLTGLTPWQRRWPAALAAVFALSSVYAVFCTAFPDPAYSAWLQPHSAGVRINAWLWRAGPGLVVFAGAAALLRLARRDGADSLRRAALLLCIAALAAAACCLLARWHFGYVSHTTGYRLPPNAVPITVPGAPPAPAVPYYRSWVFNDALAFTGNCLEHFVWAGLAATALLTRAGRRSGAPATT